VNDYQQRLDALFQLEFFGMKLGLDNIHALLDFLGNPQRNFPSIHIAGTNGKGSVASMLAAVHQTAGKKTGLYTSPHLIDFRERTRIDGEMISQEEVAEFLERVWPKVEVLRATFFEVTTAMAFDHFARHNVDIAIIETGLGGRLDATNVLEQPLATVVTSIGYDHMAQLGNTLEGIASEKAGIFKRGVPAVVNCTREVEHVFHRKADEVGVPLLFVRGFEPPRALKSICSGFSGKHQEDNLRTVLATLHVLPEQLAPEIIERGIRHAASFTGLRGRLEEIHSKELSERGVRLFLDVGHNAEALEAVSRFFSESDIRPIAVFGIMKDKDVAAALQTLSGFAKSFVAVAASTERALASADLAAAASGLPITAIDGGEVKSGFLLALEQAERGDAILVSGSHYVVGEFIQNFRAGSEVNVHAVAKPKLRNSASFG
jgi:dihydrofolate synthase/folylpolyglutamate synthase